MERFSEYQDVYGKIDIDNQVGIINQMFKSAAEIRQRLGKKGYLLENYLSLFLESVIAACDNFLTTEGDCLSNELNGLILRVMDGKTDNNPFYETVKNYIDSHPLNYQEKVTRHRFYSTALFADYLTYRAKGHREFLSESIRHTADNVLVGKLHEEINGIIGSGSMEKLNLLLGKVFLSVLPMNTFIQMISISLADCLTYRDCETSRLIVGLWLDSLNQKGEC